MKPIHSIGSLDKDWKIGLGYNYLFLHLTDGESTLRILPVATLIFDRSFVFGGSDIIILPFPIRRLRGSSLFYDGWVS